MDPPHLSAHESPQTSPPMSPPAGLDSGLLPSRFDSNPNRWGNSHADVVSQAPLRSALVSAHTTPPRARPLSRHDPPPRGDFAPSYATPEGHEGNNKVPGTVMYGGLLRPGVRNAPTLYCHTSHSDLLKK
jgi:hypothetical protein